MKYGLNPRFAFANGYFMLLPAGLPERFYEGEGENVHIGNFVICLKKDTPKEIRDRLISEYQSYLSEQSEMDDFID